MMTIALGQKGKKMAKMSIPILVDWESIKDYLAKSDIVEVVRCKDCKHKTDCFSEVAMTNKYQTTTLYEPIEWCSKGEREE